MHLPIHLSIRERLCLLVGNSPLVQSLIPRLSEQGAQLRCVDLRQRSYRREDLEGVFLAITDADDPAINNRVAADARSAGILVMRGDLPAAGDFTLPGPQPGEAISQGSETSFRTENRNPKAPPGSGRVFLVGAGPGDPGLLTIKGAACLQAADVVLFDAIANPLLVTDYASQAEKIDVGKHKGHCKYRQEEITRLMLDLARQGRNVVRLKGGDPTIFGRGGEEARALFKAGIPFEIVPGVSCVAAVPAYAGIPITDREYGSSFGVYTIHKKDGAGLTEEQWQRMAAGPDTLILLMGKTMLATVAEKLVRQGRPAATPVALITDGTTCRQKYFVGTLATIAETVARESDGTEGPGLIVIGQAVSAGSDMQWFRPGPQEELIGTTERESAFALLGKLLEGIAA
ncbi:MAG: uroporphyrinogen-III C-methyltransferase [Desulfuromonadaceae bacterium]